MKVVSGRKGLWSKNRGVLAGKKMNEIWEMGSKNRIFLRADKKNKLKENWNKYV